MRPRPFKFFFGAAIAIMLFFFVARIFLAALVFAAIASTIYFIFRSIGNFFRKMTWHDEEYEYQEAYGRPRYRMDWRQLEAEPLTEVGYEDFVDFNRKERIIQVR